MSKVADLDKNLAERGIFSLRLEDARFPSVLKKIPQPPKKIYFIGDISTLKESTNLGIVGARKATVYSKNLLSSIIKDLAEFKPCIVSGGATGIDMTAHVSALENSLATIIVLGSGILSSKFDLNSFFIKKLRENPASLIISEFEPLMHAERWTFAYRNRLIAALSDSLLVVQAAESSGSLITAGYATKYKKNLYALNLKGNLFSGNQSLIESKKATPINSSEEFIGALKEAQQLKILEIGVPLHAQDKSLIETEKKEVRQTKESLEPDILNFLGSGACSFDHLKSSLGYSVSELARKLSLLEIKGIIQKTHQGEFFKTS